MDHKEILYNMYNQFKVYFPNVAERVIDWYPTGRVELTLILEDKSRAVYNILDNTLRTMRRDADTEVLSEEEWLRYFSARLTSLLREKRMTQAELSEITGISQSLISRYIRSLSLPSSHNIYKIARALECPISELTEYDF